MNEKEAYQWIKDRVFMGTFDARTLESPCKEIVMYLQESPNDKELFTKALSDFVKNEELVVQQHVENTAYLVVNLRNRDALEKFISKLNNVEDFEGVLGRLAIATIRSFPCPNEGKKAYLPLLIEWLRREETATIAYEALCQIYPEDAIAYLLWASSHHTTNKKFVQKMLTDIYFNQRQEQSGLQALEKLSESWKQLIFAVCEHPLMPDSAKKQVLSEYIKSVSSRSKYVRRFFTETNLSGEVSFESLTQTLLKLVSEKTGYPIEMLDLDLDMEADLGLDTIERIDILEVFQKHNALPKFTETEVDIERIANLKTLQQVIDFLDVQIGDENGA